MIQQTRRDHFWEGRDTPPARSYSWPQKKYLGMLLATRISTKTLYQTNTEGWRGNIFMPEFVSRNVFSQIFPPNPSEKVYRCQASGFWKPKSRILIITTHSQAFRKTEDLGGMEEKEKQTGSGNWPANSRVEGNLQKTGTKNPIETWVYLDLYGKKTLQRANQSGLGKHERNQPDSELEPQNWDKPKMKGP